MSDSTTALVILLACIVLTGAAGALRWRPPIAVSVGVALALRIVVAVYARGHTPTDTEAWFRGAATLVRHGRDPITQMRQYDWNFLPTMPYLWSLLLRLHQSWDTTLKGLAIAADCANTVLVGALAVSRARTRALQYALNPVALLVVAWHGQIEPIALVCGLSALLLLRRQRYSVAGLVVGLGAAIKTWPIVFALAVFRGTPRPLWLRVLACVLAVPLTILITMPLFLSINFAEDARGILGYRSTIGLFGWSGVVNLLRGNMHFGHTGGIFTTEQRISTLLLLVSLVAVLRVWRRATAEVVMLAALLAFVVTAAGFGVQYLMWPLPLAIAYATRRTWFYIWPASLYAALFYLHRLHLDAMTAVSMPVVIGALIALPLDQRIRMPVHARLQPHADSECDAPSVVPAITTD